MGAAEEAAGRRAGAVAGHLGGARGVRVGGEAARALREGRAVVALESTIVCHGMPWPENLATARAVAAAVRAAGAVPATAAVLAGVPTVGLEDAELERLAREGAGVAKCAARDLPQLVARGADGATTVSATMLLAARAGVQVFVTGGVGGVHRGGESSMDVSSDLTELRRTPVCVVSAGVKSILDIPRTLEYLETQGVPVAAVGQDDFPAFFSRSSGLKAPARVDSAEEGAALFEACRVLGLGGCLLGVPVPAAAEAEGARIERAIERALAEAGEQGVAGSRSTPFMLRRVKELTGGASLETNIALVKNNAAFGAAVAVALSRRHAAARRA